jgi:beta-lactamase regulating signal transducer with metallopeptidase domain
MLLFETTGNLLVALGKTIIHSVWIGLFILAVLRMVLLAIPERLSNQRYLVSVASMVLLAGAVFATFILIYVPGSREGSDLRIFGSQSIVPQILVMENSAESSWKPNLLFTLCSYFYFTGMVFMVLRSAFSYRFIRSLRNSGQVVNGEWQQRLKRISESLGIKRALNFLESDQITGPLLIGILKPAVIVPVGMLTHLSVSQVESILIHELYHLKRLDYLVNIMQLFLEGLLFYNPAIWFISDRIRREREHSCDDAVVQTSNDPVNYAKALVRLAEQQHYIRLVPGAGGSNKHHFVTRIKRIINRNNMKKNMLERVMSLLLFAGAIMLVVLITGFSSVVSITLDTDKSQQLYAPPAKPVSMLSAIPVQDTIRVPEEQEALNEREAPDWDQIREDMEAARLEAMEGIDWDQIKEDMEAARLKAMEGIDWDQIKEDMKAARIDAMTNMDSVFQDIDADFDMDFDVDIEMESIRESMEEARKEMKEIDWEEMKQEMERSFSEMQIDMEVMKREIEESMKEIDWDEIRREMENTRLELDSLFIEKDI